MAKINHYKTAILALLLIGWILALFIESSQPPLKILEEIKGLDKVAHFLAFTFLGLLICALSFKLHPKPKIQLFSLPLFIVIVIGIIEESYQMLIPGRASELLDLLADTCGALFAIFIANRIAYIMHTKNLMRLE
ncbi:MAG: VanZ family protein [Methylococcaceae bacterium]|uniref:VanZ family protein n=1 Tax=Methylicorpusculum sp. TaxID=2713644 RepID=UPI00271C345B|nr:VanZ family protein [Methylicorpusculum sp.]MDO9161832.1 VanZ family protein [Methylococcaceae bacterium]MDZ4158028.1 VanZ family protein [Methylococcales bacterium]MDP2392819.1 VanZ family protein [Methylococcaceae bacterium]MDP3020347.1 VanZ family protein [Methylococcaceae bacterium]MDP3391954.1 VanZ family protein [Methylococcaceae bacterium]